MPIPSRPNCIISAREGSCEASLRCCLWRRVSYRVTTAGPRGTQFELSRTPPSLTTAMPAREFPCSKQVVDRP